MSPFINLHFLVFVLLFIIITFTIIFFFFSGEVLQNFCIVCFTRLGVIEKTSHFIHLAELFFFFFKFMSVERLFFCIINYCFFFRDLDFCFVFCFSLPNSFFSSFFFFFCISKHIFD